MERFPKSLISFQRMFPDEAPCAAWLFSMRWPEGFQCPGCGHDHGWALRAKAHTFECTSCHRQTSVTAGTILHGSKLDLTVWFWAAYLMATHSNGISALQLQKQLALGSYRTAWMLAAKLRRAMVDPDRNPLSGLVEIDEILNSWDNEEINRFTPDEKRPRPFSRIIYIGDGETDVPAMKMINYQGGYSIVVYPPKEGQRRKPAEMQKNKAQYANRMHL